MQNPPGKARVNKSNLKIFQNGVSEELLRIS